MNGVGSENAEKGGTRTGCGEDGEPVSESCCGQQVDVAQCISLRR